MKNPHDELRKYLDRLVHRYLNIKSLSPLRKVIYLSSKSPLRKRGI